MIAGVKKKSRFIQVLLLVRLGTKRPPQVRQGGVEELPDPTRDRQETSSGREAAGKEKACLFISIQGFQIGKGALRVSDFPFA